MKQNLTIIAVAAMTLTSTAATAATENYRVEANDTDIITLTLCKPQVEVIVMGDHDTDLDFRITDPRGRVVHSDYDDTDVTYASIRTGGFRNVGGSCPRYRMEVINRGDIFNRYSVTISD